MAGGSWESDGLCHALKRSDPGLWQAFYADRAADRQPAKAVCAECPVRLDCLSSALDRGEVWGVWGGCDEVDLRRALWTDTNGTERERLRFPRCPACRARSEVLFIRSACPIDGGPPAESVECGSCAFSWSAASSVAAVKAFWARETGVAEPVQMRRPARVRVPRGRIHSDRPAGAGRPNLSREPERTPTEPVRGLAASGRPLPG